MPAAAPPSAKALSAQLAALGARLRAHRKALEVNAQTAAEAAGISRVTLHRIEQGAPSVTMGAYLNAIHAIGLSFDLVDPNVRRKARRLPKRIPLAEYPQLRRIAWQLSDVAALTPREAFALYERNWRHVDRAALTERERDLVHQLTDALGGERLLV